MLHGAYLLAEAIRYTVSNSSFGLEKKSKEVSSFGLEEGSKEVVPGVVRAWVDRLVRCHEVDHFVDYIIA